MNIHQIAQRLNERATNEGFQIGSLPELRKKYLGKKQLPEKIFTHQTIFDREDKYAFHNGGRDEIQFNIGSEYIDKEKIFTRVALCFSLEPSHSLPDPVKDLEPFRKRFNQCIELHPEFFNGFEMWYYQNEKRLGNFAPQKIPDNWFKRKTFIAVGRIIAKPLSELNENDLVKVLQCFDKLLPIYQFCVLQSPIASLNEKRIAKVCWNKYNWVYPSGRYGKSIQINSHENKRGYGHEEWLFDFEKLIEGYHYALLQSVQNGRKTFLNKYFDVRLFSRNSDTKENLWIGSIKNLEVISNEEAIKIYRDYKNNGWLNEMVQDIKSVHGDWKYFKTLKPYECFNVRFKPEFAKLDVPFKLIDNFKSLIGTYHYQFIYAESDKKGEKAEKLRSRNFKFKSGKSDKSLTNRVSTRQRRAVQSEPLHDKIQEILYDRLLEIHGEKNVGMEVDTGLATRIDVAVNTIDGIILYEVKSYPSVMITIRAALGQLIEYAFYPNPIKNLKELIIVSHIPIEQEDIEYLDIIRQITSLNIFYQSIDIETKTISGKA